MKKLTREEKIILAEKVLGWTVDLGCRYFYTIHTEHRCEVVESDIEDFNPDQKIEQMRIIFNKLTKNEQHEVIREFAVNSVHTWGLRIAKELFNNPYAVCMAIIKVKGS